MNYLFLILIAVSLSLDAFSVSICNGMVMELNVKRRLFIAGTFGAMQGIMPLIGYFVGSLFVDYIKPYDGILSFALLLIIGLKMIIDAVKSRKENCSIAKFSIPTVLVQGIATSIDAIAVGVSLLTMNILVWISVSVIAAVTFLLTLLALLFGEKLIGVFRGRTYIAEIIGGCVLILIGLKLLLESLLG